MFKGLLLIFISVLFHHGCMQSENSHSSDKSTNQTIKDLEELQKLIDLSNSEDSETTLTVSQKAYDLMGSKCINCHVPFHFNWQINDNYWLTNEYEYDLIKMSDGNPNSTKFIDRLAVWGTDTTTPMPQDGAPLTEEEYNTFVDWIKFLNEQK